MPDMKTIASIAPYHGGGLGQHLSYVVEEARAAGRLSHYFAKSIKPGDEAVATPVRSRWMPLLARYTPLRWSPGGLNHTENELFDRAVAGQLRRPIGGPIDTFLGFGGTALRCFKQARKLGAKRLELLAANSHVNNVARLHAQAIARYPLETSWLNEAQRQKTLAEYEMADVILIASDYSMRIFIENGVSERKLLRVHYPMDPRFTPRTTKAQNDGVFRIVYCGSMTAVKGVPDLIEAFTRFRSRDAELRLVGGTGSRGMNHYMQEAMARDPRIKMAPGDPLPHFRAADVYVHPSYEDNLAYAACEAIQSGVPAIVTADTGAKEFLREGETGWVVPTGDWKALLERLEHVAQLSA
jgi:glycosyltransferase involved in cell wall biosynthesis